MLCPLPIIELGRASAVDGHPAQVVELVSDDPAAATDVGGLVPDAGQELVGRDGVRARRRVATAAALRIRHT